MLPRLASSVLLIGGVASLPGATMVQGRLPKPKTPAPRKDEVDWECFKPLTQGRPNVPFPEKPRVTVASSRMTTTVELAVAPAADMPGTCIHLHCDKNTYLFGHVAEGTQRTFGARKVPFTSTKHVFLSGAVEWQHLGGLLGFLLSTATAVTSSRENTEAINRERKAKSKTPLPIPGDDGVGVHGGDNLAHTLAAFRAVIFRQPMQVRLHEQRDDPRADANATTNEPDWEDEFIRVWKLPVRRTRSSSPTKRRHDDSPAAQGEQPSQPSDPSLASLIVESTIFNGKAEDGQWVRRQPSEVKPTDKAVLFRSGNLFAYKGETDGEVYVLTPNENNKGNRKYNDEEDNDDAPDADQNAPNLQIPSLNVKGAGRLPPTTYSNLSMSYIVKCHDRRGKFDPAAAKALGVAPRDFGRLTKGESVRGKDDVEVTPDMVLGEPSPGRGIVVADIASPDFVDEFLARREWTDGKLMANIDSVFWLLGPGMARDARLQKFMADRPAIRHILCAPDTCPNAISIGRAAELHTALRCIDADRFPQLHFDDTVDLAAATGGGAASAEVMEVGRPGTKFKLMPRYLDEGRPAPSADLAAAVKAIGQDVLQMARDARELSTSAAFLARIEEQEKDIPNRDAEIVALGTGSSMPSKYRNVSGTLIRVPGFGCYLLDCGEGTLGQLRRLYGPDGVRSVLRELRCIVISHIHADHHLGIVSLIKAWYEQALADGDGATTLAVVCIVRFWKQLAELAQVEDFGFHRLRFPSCPSGLDRDLTTAKNMADECDGADYGLASILRVPVPHCWKSYGTQLELKSGLRVAYSGDCRPSAKFAQACQGAHLLVHEATFANDMQSHARKKRHSTIDDALDVARQMRARRTLLTHFSQRYIKAPPLRPDEADAEQSVAMALDLMTIKLGDFQKAACFTPVIQQHLELEED